MLPASTFSSDCQENVVVARKCDVDYFLLMGEKLVDRAVPPIEIPNGARAVYRGTSDEILTIGVEGHDWSCQVWLRHEILLIENFLFLLIVPPNSHEVPARQEELVIIRVDEFHLADSALEVRVRLAFKYSFAIICLCNYNEVLFILDEAAQGDPVGIWDRLGKSTAIDEPICGDLEIIAVEEKFAFHF